MLLTDTPPAELKEMDIFLMDQVEYLLTDLARTAQEAQGPGMVDIFLMDQVEYLLTDRVRTAQEAQDPGTAQAMRMATSTSITTSYLTIRSPSPPSLASQAATEENVGEPKCGGTSSRSAQRCSPFSIGPRALTKRPSLRPCGVRGSGRKDGGPS